MPARNHILILIFFPVILGLGFSCCNRSGNSSHDSGYEDPASPAPSGFGIRETPDGYLLTVRNPWQGSGKVTFRYLLTRKNIPADTFPGIHTIRIPVKKVICTSTTHIAFVTALKETGSVVGISGKNLVTNPEIKRNIREGKIADIGYDKQLNFEQIVTLHPDVIFMYGVDKQVTGTIQRIESLGIPVVMVGDYLEPTLLNRLEWIRFFGAFFDKSKASQHYYDSVASRYLTLMEQHPEEPKPTVMTGLPWNEVWYVSGRGSLISNMIHDAGGNYIFGDLSSSEAVPMDIEKVYRIAKDADIWINAGTARTLNEITSTDPRLSLFRPFVTQKVFNNNRRLNPTGGNDYWESGVISPDRILADLVAIFYPGSLPDHPMYYYQQLK